MLVLGLDFETTFTDPVDPKLARITEIGACLWDTERKAPLVLVNRLVYAQDYPPFDPRIESFCGIAESDLLNYGTKPKGALEKLNKLFPLAEAILAHNARGFDKIVYESECERNGVPVVEKHWVDTQTDIQYPEKIGTRKLQYLGPDHGFLNPFSHRALFDVLSMLKVVSHYDFAAILERSKIPEIVVRADIAKPFGPTEALGKKQVDEAKVRGYKFDGERKIWSKRIKEDELPKEMSEAPFKVVVVR